MKYLKSPLLHKIQPSTENTKITELKNSNNLFYQYIFDANNSIKASYSINTLYSPLSFLPICTTRTDCKQRLVSSGFRIKTDNLLEIHANCFNMYLVVANKFSFKSGMINNEEKNLK